MKMNDRTADSTFPDRRKTQCHHPCIYQGGYDTDDGAEHRNNGAFQQEQVFNHLVRKTHCNHHSRLAASLLYPEDKHQSQQYHSH